MKLEKDNAVSEWRNLMGATDSTKAEPGTIRAKYGTDISMNATHGSDSDENAEKEINFFFKTND
jgi:nucleoside-diphosphate kinase